MLLNNTHIDTKRSLDALRDSHPVSSDDATWILTSAFIIFTMQSGECEFYIITLCVCLFVFPSVVI